MIIEGWRESANIIKRRVSDLIKEWENIVEEKGTIEEGVEDRDLKKLVGAWERIADKVGRIHFLVEEWCKITASYPDYRARLLWRKIIESANDVHRLMQREKWNQVPEKLFRIQGLIGDWERITEDTELVGAGEIRWEDVQRFIWWLKQWEKAISEDEG